MLEVRPFRDTDAARWDAYVEAAPDSHFGQLIAWKTLTERAYGCPADYAIAEEGGRVRGVLPLFAKSGRYLFSAPGGLLADDERVAEALLAPARERVKRERLDWLELRDQRRAWPGLETSREHVTLELALEPSAEAQWKRFDPKLRNQVRKAEKSGFEAKWGHDRVDAFHRVMLENMRDLGTPIRGAEYYRAALEALGKRADLLVLEREGRPAGAMFFVAHGDGALDPWASSLRRYFAMCPNHGLYWEAIRRAIALGLKRFDFGRSQRDSGTFAFKQSWGALPVQLHYQYALGRATAMPTLSGQKDRYATFVGLWRRLPVPLAGVLGERVKRMFPEVM
jgi:FemAB-related protein (PEP-CTERM system-associated)